MKERWRPVVGFEGAYEVSDLGRVRSLDRTISNGKRWKGRIRTVRPQKDGRLVVVLYWGGKHTSRRVHRLVLEAFVGPCPDGMEACHFPDRNPVNCRLDNLRWDTHQSNLADRIKHGTSNRGELHGNSKLTSSDVKRAFRLRRTGHTYQEIADAIGVHRGTVGKLIKGQRWQHLGLAQC